MDMMKDQRSSFWKRLALNLLLATPVTGLTTLQKSVSCLSNEASSRLLGTCALQSQFSSRDFSIFDRNKDGKLSVQEIISSPSELMISHSSLAKTFIANWKQLFITLTDMKNVNKVLSQLSTIMTPLDFCVILLLIFTHKRLLRTFFHVTHPRVPASDKARYSKSLLGALETGITLIVWYPPALVIIDAVSVLANHLHLVYSTKADIPSLFSLVYNSVIIGSIVTKVKDWFAYRLRKKRYKLKPRLEARDQVREAVTDEMASLVCWFLVAVSCLQAMSLELGIALGSIFALGGIGSASIVLALRSSMENLVGGVLLKLQDKLREGEKISIPGTTDEGEVEEVTYLHTFIRLDDDSITAIPNAHFIQGHVVNWSRTPYRLFKTTLKLHEADLHLLPSIVRSLQQELSAMGCVEAAERELIVAATGFVQDYIKVQVEVRLRAVTDLEIATTSTQVVNKIASVLDKTYAQRGTQGNKHSR